MVYQDECRFSRQVSVPYAWQRRGQPPVELPAVRGRGGYSVPGFWQPGVPGQPLDAYVRTEALIADLFVLADQAYDADYVRAQLEQAGAGVVIPGKKNRTVPIGHDAEIYKERNRIERAINGLKRFRVVATRFDKQAANYFATCYLIAALTWLRL